MEKQSNITIRSAQSSDALFVAWTCMVALGRKQVDKELLASVSELNKRTDVLYSWRNTLIAEIDRQPVGALVCYDGACYREMREITFPLIAQMSGNDFRDMELETGPGEFYIDSMAVLPEHRQQGVATALLRAGIERARKLGIPKVTMVVSPENPNAQRLYESLGFHFERDMFLFGENYRKMAFQHSFPFSQKGN